MVRVLTPCHHSRMTEGDHQLKNIGVCAITLPAIDTEVQHLMEERGQWCTLYYVAAKRLKLGK